MEYLFKTAGWPFYPDEVAPIPSRDLMESINILTPVLQRCIQWVDGGITVIALRFPYTSFWVEMVSRRDEVKMIQQGYLTHREFERYWQRAVIRRKQTQRGWYTRHGECPWPSRVQLLLKENIA